MAHQPKGAPSAALRRALTEPGEPVLRPLPSTVVELLEAVEAPPRLAAHLRAVHHTAWRLTGQLTRQVPELLFDDGAVLFGAATHDIGKAVHVDELSGPGGDHEDAGYHLLLRFGVPPRLARFAATHAAWAQPGAELEDLLVSVADTVWKGARVAELEELVTDRIAAATGARPWEAFARLDDIIDPITADASALLAFQARHPV